MSTTEQEYIGDVQKHASRVDHARIVKAILAGDGGAAEKAMRLHINNSTDGILQSPPEFFAS